MFSVLDTTAKYLTMHMDQFQVAWARFTSAFVLTLLISNPWNTPRLLHTKRIGLQITRGLLLCASTVLGVIALRYIQLDEATAIAFSGPLIIAALAGPMLGEWIGPRRWAAIFVGFLGVLVVTRPGFSGIHPAAMLTFLCAVCYSLYTLVTRMQSDTERPDTSLFYANVIGVVILTPLLPFVWTAPATWKLVLLMCLTGAVAGLGHFFLIMAVRRAPASVLSPFMYSQLVWVILIGYVVFGQLPSTWSLAGASLIVGSGLYLIHRERVRTGKVQRLM